jgi:hypothetical protein
MYVPVYQIHSNKGCIIMQACLHALVLCSAFFLAIISLARFSSSTFSLDTLCLACFLLGFLFGLLLGKFLYFSFSLPI